MKHILCPFIALFITMTAFAQKKDRTVEETLSVIGNYASTTTINFVYPVTENFGIGWGVGLRGAYQVYRKMTKTQNGVTTHSNQRIIELDIPVYLRLRYSLDKLYLNMDMGYAQGLFSHLPDVEGVMGSGLPYISGFFLEPQGWYKINDKYSVGGGLLLQRYLVSEHTSIIDENGASDSEQTRPKWVPSLNLRLARHF